MKVTKQIQSVAMKLKEAESTSVIIKIDGQSMHIWIMKNIPPKLSHIQEKANKSLEPYLWSHLT